MDINKQFSLTDFLAYFFPGLFTTTGLYLFLLLTPLRPSLSDSFSSITAGLVFVAISYVIGILFSGISLNIVERVEKRQKHKDSRASILLEGFDDDVLRAFSDIFEMNKDVKNIRWSKEHFYICRTLVLENMPTVAQRVERQSSLRQLRGNLILPIIVWMLVGIGWGISLVQFVSSPGWGFTLIVSSLIIGALFLRVTFSRMHNNEDREVREVLTGFLAGYRTGILTKAKHPKKAS
jgi:hypothetical protein